MIPWIKLSVIKHQRQRALAQASGALADYLQQPLPAGSTGCKQLKFAALDFETTGLNPEQDKLLSIGVVPFDLRGIPMEQVSHTLIQSPMRIPEQSAVLHGITDDTSASGRDIQSALRDLLGKLQQRTLITHHSAIELGFLNRMCRRFYNAPFVCINIDTEQLARRYFNRRNQPVKAGDLRLYRLRERFGLPRYKAHNALNDALATAELFLALSTSITAHRGCKLRDFL